MDGATLLDDPVTWTYTLPLTAEKDQVRFLVQDTIETRQLLQDEEIAFLLDEEANIYTAAARGIEVILSANQGRSLRTAADVTVEWFEPGKAQMIATMLRARGLTYQTPSAGGISLSDKQTLEQDSDWPRLPVFLGSMDSRYSLPVDPLVDSNQVPVPGV